jgi:putative photosynthetic complex assembly protein
MSGAMPGAQPEARSTTHMLAGVAIMLAIVLGVAILARLHVAGTRIPVSTPVAERSLRFVDRPDHGIAVSDADTGELVAIIEGPAGFLRPTLSGLAEQRLRDERSPATPFRLTRWADGRLTLDDPETGRHIELEAFGPTNEAAFARFLTAPERRP